MEAVRTAAVGRLEADRLGDRDPRILRPLPAAAADLSKLVRSEIVHVHAERAVRTAGDIASAIPGDPQPFQHPESEGKRDALVLGHEPVAVQRDAAQLARALSHRRAEQRAFIDEGVVGKTEHPHRPGVLGLVVEERPALRGLEARKIPPPAAVGGGDQRSVG